MTNEDLTQLAQENAGRVHAALEALGFTVEVMHYPASASDDRNRTYLNIDHEGHTYSTQFHERRPQGHSYTTHQGEAYDPAFAEHLDSIVKDVLS